MAEMKAVQPVELKIVGVDVSEINGIRPLPPPQKK